MLAIVVPGLAQESKPGVTRATTQAKRTVERQIIVSIPDRKLALVEDGRVAKVYRIGVGAPSSPSPVGAFKIVSRIPDPTWYATGQPVPPGPANPLGTRWLGLSLKGYGIHGTNAPRSIGRRASHGCIRMHNHDVEELFELVRAGDVVELHGERTAELAQIFTAPAAPPVPPAALPAAPVPVVAALALGGSL